MSPDGVTVGALARHSRVEHDAAAGRVQPLLAQALRLVAHPTIRNRGTTVGSLAHADPAGEMTAVLALCGGTVTARLDPRAAGDRRRRLLSRPAGIGICGRTSWRSRPSSRHCRPGPAQRSSRSPAGTAITRSAGSAPSPNWTSSGGGPGPALRLPVGLRHAAGAGPDAGLARPARTDAAEQARRAVDPQSDLHATADYRRHLAGVLTVRAGRQAISAARARRRGGMTEPEHRASRCTR